MGSLETSSHNALKIALKQLKLKNRGLDHSRAPRGSVIPGYLVWIICLFIVSPCWAATPNITIQDEVVKLYEDVMIPTPLATVNCDDPVDSSDVVAFGDITPTTNCVKCFLVLPVDLTTGEYEVKYFPSVATLDFNTCPEYTVTITCKNTVDPPKTMNLYVRLIPNSPPYFVNGLTDTLSLSNTKNIPAGQTIYSVAAADPDSDPIYYTLKTTPTSSSFAIGYTSGDIYAVNDLSSECYDQSTFEVTLSDGKLTSVSPQVITVNLGGYNKAPYINNLNALARWPEDTAVGTTLINLDVQDDSASTTLTYTTIPADALGLFDLNNFQLNLKSALDYESFNLQRPLFIVTADDGSCTSKTYTYTLSVTDVNEPPVIKPKNQVYSIYEGNIVLDPAWTTTDPDFGDTKTYSIKGSNPSFNRFTIDPDTGVIKSLIEYDVDQNAMTSTVTLTVQVSDSKYLNDTTTAILYIKDANDNAPEFATGTLDQFFTITECSSPGQLLGTLVATDKDSSFQDNNVITYSTTTTTNSGGVTITPGGDIILNKVSTAGTSETYTVIATDHGLYPGPLTCLVPGTVTVTFTPCPTTTTTTTTTTTKTTTTPTTTKTTTPKAQSFSTSDNLWWIILAALFGTAFVGVTAWLCLSRVRNFCAGKVPQGHWARGCSGQGRGLCDGQCCQRKKVPKPQQTRVIEMKPRPTGIQPGSGNAGFWKERFPDDIYNEMPERNRTPEPANYDAAPDQVADTRPKKDLPDVDNPAVSHRVTDRSDGIGGDRPWSSGVQMDYGQGKRVNPRYDIDDIL